MSYVLRHWRGEFSIYWSLVVNGVEVYALAVALALSIGGILQSLDLKKFYILVLAFFLIIIWSLTGVVRTGLRTLVTDGTGASAKIVSMAGLALCALSLVPMVYDLPIIWKAVFSAW